MQADPVAHENFEREGSLFYEFRFLLLFRSKWLRFRDFAHITPRSHPYEIR